MEGTEKNAKRRRFIIGGVVIALAVGYVIYGGMRESIVYFVTPEKFNLSL
jgi:cytochrome c-type biogenesis protein CcmE